MLRRMLAARGPRRLLWRSLLISLTLLPHATCALATDSASGGARSDLRKQIEEIKSDERSERRRFDSDEQHIHDLERELQLLATENQKLSGATQQLAITNSNLKAETDQRIDSLQQQVASGVSPAEFDSAFSRYLGTHQFTVAGDAAGGFIYDRKTSQNTFT